MRRNKLLIGLARPRDTNRFSWRRRSPERSAALSDTDVKHWRQPEQAANPSWSASARPRNFASVSGHDRPAVSIGWPDRPVPGIAAPPAQLHDQAHPASAAPVEFNPVLLGPHGVFALAHALSLGLDLVRFERRWFPNPRWTVEEGGEQGARRSTSTPAMAPCTALFQALACDRSGGRLAHDRAFLPASLVITLVGGTMFLMLLANRYRARHRNGISLIIFVVSSRKSLRRWRLLCPTGRARFPRRVILVGS